MFNQVLDALWYARKQHIAVLRVGREPELRIAHDQAITNSSQVIVLAGGLGHFGIGFGVVLEVRHAVIELFNRVLPVCFDQPCQLSDELGRADVDE